MQLNTKDFRDVLARLKPAVSTKTSLPALACIRITSGGNCAKFLSSNLDLWVDTFCAGKDGLDWSFCVRFDKLERASRFWVADTLTLLPNAAGTALVVKCGAYTLPLPVLPAAELHDAPLSEGEPVAVEDFAVKLKRLAPFCSDDPTRGPLQGVHLGNNFMEAANGLSLLHLPACFDGRGFLFPADAIMALGDDPSVLHLGESVVSVCSGDTTITTRRLEGGFPETATILPDMAQRQLVTCWRAELISAVEYCLGQSKNGNWSNLCLDITEKQMSVCLSRADSEGEPPVKELPCKSPLELRVALSAPRLSTLLRAFEGDEVALGFDGNKSPVAIEQSGARAVLLLSRIDA